MFEFDTGVWGCEVPVCLGVIGITVAFLGVQPHNVLLYRNLFRRHDNRPGANGCRASESQNQTQFKFIEAGE
jgi:hypothetical protein